MNSFVECSECSSKPGTPILCNSCLLNRKSIAELNNQVETLCRKLCIGIGYFYECDECNGKGALCINGYTTFIPCTKCNGTGRGNPKSPKFF